MENLGNIEWLLIGISILLAGYSIYMYFDQKSNLRFHSPKSKAIYIVAAVVIVIGIANYFIQNQSMEAFASGIVLLMFSLIMLLARNGIGESGIYNEGIRISWKQIKKANVINENGMVYMNYVRGKQNGKILLVDVSQTDIDTYLKKIRRLYHIGK